MSYGLRSRRFQKTSSSLGQPSRRSSMAHMVLFSKTLIITNQRPKLCLMTNFSCFLTIVLSFLLQTSILPSGKLLYIVAKSMLFPNTT